MRTYDFSPLWRAGEASTACSTRLTIRSCTKTRTAIPPYDISRLAGSVALAGFHREGHHDYGAAELAHGRGAGDERFRARVSL